MSTRFSPDGLYYWDGARWVSTLSHDGRSRWDGTRWVPLQGAPVYAPAVHSVATRQPTSWTRPLQYAVVAYYVLAAIYTMALPFTMSGVMTQVMNQSLQQQQSLNPEATPLPAGFTTAMSSMFTFILLIGAIGGLAICVVAIIAALKRWTWAYYAIMALLGLGVLSLFYDIVALIAGSAMSGVYGGAALPSWIYDVGIAGGVIDGCLLTWMVIALTRYGPWAMRRVAA